MAVHVVLLALTVRGGQQSRAILQLSAAYRKVTTGIIEENDFLGGAARALETPLSPVAKDAISLYFI
jgi:hypothetical protein